MTSTHVSCGVSRRHLLASAAALPILSGTFLSGAKRVQAQADPLPSWNEGAAKQSILGFVAAAPHKRIFVFR